MAKKTYSNPLGHDFKVTRNHWLFGEITESFKTRDEAENFAKRKKGKVGRFF